MPKLNGDEAIRRGSDVGQSRTPASIRFDGQGLNRGLANAAQTTAAAGRAIEGAGDHLGRASRSLQAVAKVQEREDFARENFETNRRFLEFTAAQEAASVEQINGSEGGAFGLSNNVQGSYKKGADEFFKSVPDRLKPQYDAKLFNVEDRIFTKAYNQEKKIRKTYYSDRTNEGLDMLEKNLRDNPEDIETVYGEGRAYISALPDSDVNPREKQAMVKAWKKKAQLASLGGMRPHERLNAVGRGYSTLQVSGAIKNQKGNRRIVADAAVAEGQNPAIALGIVSIESGFKANAKNSNSSASGFYQFISSTGAQYGLDENSVMDGQANASAGARLLRDNGKYLRDGTGREPSPGELYLAHFSGAGTALKLMRANPNASASSVFSSEAVQANGSILKGKTVAEVIDWANSKMAKHMREAGADVQEIPGTVSNPAYADLSLDEVDRVQKEAYAQLRDERSTMAAVEREQAAISKAQSTAHSDRVGLLVQTGELTSERDILTDGMLDDGDKTKHLKALKTKRKETVGAASDAASIANGKLTLNSFDSDDRKRADKAWEYIEKAAGENATPELVETFTKRAGTVPVSVVSAMTRDAMSGDPETVGAALIQAQRLRAAVPTGFQGIPSSSELGKQVDQYEAFLRRGYSSENAVKRVVASGDPDQQASRKAYMGQDDVKKFVKGNATAKEIASSFNPTGPTGAPQVGVGPTQQGAIVSEYRGLLEDALMEVTDKDAAKDLAMTRFKRIYGVSTMNLAGERVLMRNPPEHHLRALPNIDTDLTDHGWVGPLLVKDLKEAGIDTDDAYLLSYGKTEAAVSHNRRVEAGEAEGIAPVPYVVAFKTPEGTIETLGEKTPFFLRKQDMEGLLDEYQEAKAQARREEVEKRKARPNLPEPKKEVVQLLDEIEEIIPEEWGNQFRDAIKRRDKAVLDRAQETLKRKREWEERQKKEGAGSSIFDPVIDFFSSNQEALDSVKAKRRKDRGQ